MYLLKVNEPVLGIVCETEVLPSLLISTSDCASNDYLHLWLDLVILILYVTHAEHYSCTQQWKLLIIQCLVGLSTYESDQPSQQVMNSPHTLLSSFG